MYNLQSTKQENKVLPIFSLTVLSKFGLLLLQLETKVIWCLTEVLCSVAFWSFSLIGLLERKDDGLKYCITRAVIKLVESTHPQIFVSAHRMHTCTNAAPMVALEGAPAAWPTSKPPVWNQTQILRFASIILRFWIVGWFITYLLTSTHIWITLSNFLLLLHTLEWPASFPAPDNSPYYCIVLGTET